MDAHVDGAITRGLRRVGVDVLTAQEDGTDRWQDSDLLDRATVTGRVLVTYDEDLLAEAHRRADAGQRFGGIVYVPSNGVSIGQCVRDLTLLAQFTLAADLANVVAYLPVR